MHWNFFFTLAMSKLSTSVLFAALPVCLSWPCALALSISYEAVLSSGLAEWILSEGTPRHDLLSANREGVFSVPGYAAIYLAGVAWGARFAKMGETFADSWEEAKSLGQQQMMGLRYLNWLNREVVCLVYFQCFGPW